MSEFEEEDFESYGLPPQPKKPGLAELLATPEIAEQISRTIEATYADGRERTFLALFSPKAGVLINKPLAGERHSAPRHILGMDERHIHPEGEGQHIPEGYHPFLFYHTHPGDSPHPSIPDLDLLYSLARQNFHLTPSESLWWINPVGICSASTGETFYFQFPPEQIIKLKNEGALLDHLGEAVLELGQRLKNPDAIKIANDPDSMGRDAVTGIVDNKFYNDFPDFMSQEKDIEEVYQLADIKFQKAPWKDQAQLVQDLESFELTPDFED